MVVHSDEKPFSCTECNKTFSREPDLKRHKITHTEEKKYKCNFDNCKSSFNTSGNLARHKRLSHKN